jgi:hypothetical protein
VEIIILALAGKITNISDLFFFFFVISFAILKSISVNYTENDHDRTIPDISVITLLPLSMLNKHYN